MLVEFELIQEGAGRGTISAFNQVVVAYRKRILGTIALTDWKAGGRGRCRGRRFFSGFYYSLDQLRTPEVFEPWLYRLTVNASYDYLRKAAPPKRGAYVGFERTTGHDGGRGGGRQSLHRARAAEERQGIGGTLLRAIPEQDRILLTLKEVEGLSLKELEKIYSVNENALKVRLFRARQRVLNVYQAVQGKAGKQAVGSA